MLEVQARALKCQAEDWASHMRECAAWARGDHASVRGFA